MNQYIQCIGSVYVKCFYFNSISSLSKTYSFHCYEVVHLFFAYCCFNIVTQKKMEDGNFLNLFLNLSYDYDKK